MTCDYAARDKAQAEVERLTQIVAQCMIEKYDLGIQLRALEAKIERHDELTEEYANLQGTAIHELDMMDADFEETEAERALWYELDYINGSEASNA